MKHLATVFALSTVMFLSGCSGVPRPGYTSTYTPPASPATPNPPPPPNPDVAGNWQFSAASTASGKPALTIAGSIGQVGSAASGELHVDGSSCFDRMAVMGLTGTVTTGTSSLTSTALNGQLVTLTGTFTNTPYFPTTFTGTYSVNGGCDGGDQGTVTGIEISFSDANSWSGTFTSSTQTTFGMTGEFAQNGYPTTGEGSIGISGTATFNTPCFSAQTLSPGSFPSGNFLLGSLVSLQIPTSNGTIAFVGTGDQDTGLMTGTYNVVGGTCDQTGTAVLSLTGWYYPG